MARKGGMATGVEVARISVKVSPDTKQFRKDLQEELTKIEREVKGNVEVKAHLDRAQAQADFDRLMEKLKAQGAKGVKINTTVDDKNVPGGGGKGGKGNGGSAVDEASRLGKMLTRIKDALTEAPNFGSGINITGYLVILTAIAAVAAPLAGLITGLLLTLPGLMALVLTPIAAVTLGLDGLKKAAEVLKPSFDELKTTMSQAAQDSFTPVFQKLNEIFPSLKSTLPSITQGLADMAAAAVGVATSPKSMAAIESTILNIGTALSAASPGIGNLTEALITLANTFTAGPLQGLVGWFNETMASFNQWVQKAAASGQLETIFNRVGEALKIVMDALGKVAGIGLDVITDPAKWEVFIGLLKGVAAAFVFIFQASSSLLQTIALVIALFRTGWANLTSVVSTVASAILTFFTNLPANASAAWQAILSFAVQVWASIVLVVQQKIDQIKSFFSGIGEWFANGWAGLVEATSAAWDGAKAAVSAGVDGVISFVAELPGKILSALGDLGGLLLGAGKAIMDGFLNGLKSAWEGVKSFVSGIAGWIKDHKGPITYDQKVLVPNGQALMEGLGKGMENGFQPVLDQAKSMAGQIADAFASGADPTQITAGYTTKEISNMEKTLGLESKRLGIQIRGLEYQAKMAGKGGLADSLKARAEDLKLQKEGLDLQKEMMDLTKSYSDTTGGGSSGNVFLDAINELMKIPNGFIGATANQAMQDLNISGNGALEAVAGYGMDFAKKGITNIFNTSNVDDTIALFGNQTNRQAQGIVGR